MNVELVTSGPKSTGPTSAPVAARWPLSSPGCRTTTSNAFPFTLSAQVPGQCYAYGTTDLDFGSVPGFLRSNADQNSPIGLTCTVNMACQFGLNNGVNATGGQRRMRQGTANQYINDELYRDAGRTSRWGANLDTDTVKGTGTGSPPPRRSMSSAASRPGRPRPRGPRATPSP